jgi:hypothetical protein
MSEAIAAKWLLAVQLMAEAPSCPTGTKLVSGQHYENVERLCLKFSQDTCWSYFPWLMALEGRTTPISVCMDEYEWPNEKGALPPVMMKFTEAEASCKSVGKRLCSEFEWELACESNEVLPFLYGFDFKKQVCVNDKPYKGYDQAKLSSLDKKVRDQETKRLYQAEPSGSREACVSAFGVHDLIGNVEEWVTTSRPEWPYVSSLKGGYWAKPRSACRGTNDSHGPNFRFYDIGFRCCVDPTSAQPAQGSGAQASAAPAAAGYLRSPYEANLHSISPFMMRTSLEGRDGMASSSSGVPHNTLEYPSPPFLGLLLRSTMAPNELSSLGVRLIRSP